MSKGLEALVKIKKLYKAYIDKIGLGINDIMGFDFSIMEIEKELKALEIIKTKHVHTRAIQELSDLFNNVEFYNKFYARLEYEDLTQEEYDLLKEVLNYGDKN